MRTREGICVGMGQGGQLGSKRGNVKLAWLIRLRLYGEYSSGITRGKGSIVLLDAVLYFDNL